MYKTIASATEDGDFLWSVYEEASEQIVDSFFFEEDADKFVRFSRNGGAFAGFTPAFMIRKNYKPADINAEFKITFEIE